MLPLARLAARRHGCPLVATMHLSMWHALRPVTARGALLRAAGAAAERRLLPGADAMIALTPSTARLLHGDGIPAGRVHVIAPGYDPALFAAASADPFPGLPRPRVAYLGRLAPQKDVDTLLQAFTLLPADTQLLLVGDGPDRPARSTAHSGSAAGRTSPGSCRTLRSRQCCGTWTCWCYPARIRISARR